MFSSWLRPTPNASSRLQAERLEDRRQPSAYYSIDGTGNNLANPEWGSTLEQFLILAPAAYADNSSSPGGAGLPGGRAVGNAVADQTGEVIFNDRLMSAMVYVWGQFIDHDFDLTASARRPPPARALRPPTPASR